MDDLIKVKPKQQYEWFQDQDTVRVRLQIKGTSSKKIDIFISDLILKVNVTEKQYVRIFDLENEIDFTSKLNTVVYSNDVLEVTLLKKEKKQWADFIVQDMDKESLKQRREQSFKVKEEYDKKFSEQLSDLKIKYDTHATREQMKQEDVQRSELQKRKDEERQKAEQYVYGDEDGSKKESAQQPQIMYTHKDYSIWSDKDLQQNEQKVQETEVPIPKPRNQKKMDIQFTERIYPQLAAREQHFKDAPMPKLKNSKGEKAGSDLENKNPLWLKDKGDEFYRNKDFYSAVNAYSQAFKLDKNFIQCVANRSAVHLYLFNYQECIRDCDTVLEFLNEKKEEELDKYKGLKFKSRLRKAIGLSWKGMIEEAIALLEKILADHEEFRNLSDLEKADTQNTLEIIRQRESSIKLKKMGDYEYKNANYNKALQLYQESVEVDNNETSLANISITYLKLQENKKCIEYCDECLEKVNSMISHANFNQSYSQSAMDINAFLLKLYLRKAKALQQENQNQQAFQTIKMAIQIDEKNKEARQLYDSIEKSINKDRVMELKEEAKGFMQKKQIKEALELYNECLKILDQNETLEYLALILNRCVCYLNLQQYDDIISNCLRGLKIIRSFKNRVISWDQNKLSKEDKQKLNDFEVRFLIRRANAYLQQNQIYNAKNDMQEALKLDPNNAQLKADYAKIEQKTN